MFFVERVECMLCQAKRIFGEEVEEEAEQQCEEPNKSSGVGAAVESLPRTTAGEAGG